jgi:Mn-containing catalase
MMHEIKLTQLLTRPTRLPKQKHVRGLVINDSTGIGGEGETDARGPWNEGGDWKIVESPELERRAVSQSNGAIKSQQGSEC